MQWPHGVQALPRGMRPCDTASLFDDPAIVRQKIGQITTKPQSGSVSTSLLGNPLIQPWQEPTAFCENPEMTEYLFGAYYICRTVKPVVEDAAADRDAWFAETAVDTVHRIAAE